MRDIHWSLSPSVGIPSQQIRYPFCLIDSKVISLWVHSWPFRNSLFFKSLKVTVLFLSPHPSISNHRFHRTVQWSARKATQRCGGSGPLCRPLVNAADLPRSDIGFADYFLVVASTFCMGFSQSNHKVLGRTVKLTKVKR